MNLHPNPPRMITVGIALTLAFFGLAFALPIEPLVTVLKPVVETLGSVGLRPDRELGFLCLFLSSALLVVGSLLPGI